MKNIKQTLAALALLFASGGALAQSGDLISTASVGVWDYYIFNENSGLWSSMNGLAAWFNGSAGFIRGTAILGALLGIFVFMFNAISGNSKISGKHLVAWFFMLSTLGLTGTARVTNMYNGQVTVVDNVPALALIPASLFSTGGYKVFSGLDTALQSSSGSYMSVSSSGFVGPLNVLLSLRSGKSLAARPNLNKSLSQVISDCANNPDRKSSIPLSRAPDALAWLQENGRQDGLTRIYKADDASQTGTIVSCTEGLSYINTQFTTLAQGGTNAESTLSEQINQGSRNTRSVNRERGVGGTRLSNGQAIDARDAGFGMLISAAVSTQQDAVMFTKNAITASMISYSLDCINETGSITTPDTCQSGAMGLADGMERWKTDSVMAGSGFLKTMFTSMGFLQAMFFGMFPIVVIFGLLMMHQIPKVLGGYMFFGAWCQSWLLVVAPIQAYVQNSVLEEVNRAMGSAGGTSPGLTLGNVNSVYEVLSTKLAMAGDLMASSQLLSLAILSGSMVAMSSLATKWSGARQMDSSLVQPKTADSGSLIKHAPMFSSTAVADGAGRSSTLVSSANASKAAIQSSYVDNVTKSGGVVVGKGTSEALSKSISTAIQKTHGNTFTTEQSRAISEDVGATLKSQMGASGLLGAAITRQFADGMRNQGFNLDAAAMKKLESSVNQAQGQAIQKLAAQDQGFMARISNGTPEQKAEAWSSVAEATVVAVGIGGAAMMGATGVGAPAAVATAAATKVAAAGVKNGVKGMLQNHFQKGADKSVELAKAGQAKGGVSGAAMVGAGLTGALVMKAGDLATAVAGNIQPLAQATTDAAIKETQTWKASSQASRGKQASVSFGEGFNETAQASINESYGLSASSGRTTTAAITLDAGTMNTYGQDEGKRSAAAAARADLASGMSGAQYENTMSKVRDASAGHSYANADTAKFAENTLFTHFASGGSVDAIFGEGGNKFGLTGADSMSHLTGRQGGRENLGAQTANAGNGGNRTFNAADRRVGGINTSVGGNVNQTFGAGGAYEGVKKKFDHDKVQVTEITGGYGQSNVFTGGDKSGQPDRSSGGKVVKE